jgi:hypothetical protein
LCHRTADASAGAVAAATATEREGKKLVALFFLLRPEQETTSTSTSSPSFEHAAVPDKRIETGREEDSGSNERETSKNKFFFLPLLF